MGIIGGVFGGMVAVVVVIIIVVVLYWFCVYKKKGMVCDIVYVSIQWYSTVILFYFQQNIRVTVFIINDEYDSQKYILDAVKSYCYLQTIFKG